METKQSHLAKLELSTLGHIHELEKERSACPQNIYDKRTYYSENSLSNYYRRQGS